MPFDRIRGYLFFCRLYGRPLMLMPPTLSAIISMFELGEFEDYLESVGLEFLPDDFDGDDPSSPSSAEIQARAMDNKPLIIEPLTRIRKIRKHSGG